MKIDLAHQTVVTVPQAARHFKLSPATAWRLVLTGRVPSVMLNKNRRVTLESFAAAFQDSSADEIESELAA